MGEEIEERIKRFQELHNNKWFHIMNWNLDIIRTVNLKDRFILIKHGDSNIFGGITHYFLKFANSEIELHKFEIQNDKLIKVISI